MAEEQEWPECILASKDIHDTDPTIIEEIKRKFPSYTPEPFRYCYNENAAKLWKRTYSEAEFSEMYGQIIDRLADAIIKMASKSGYTIRELIERIVPPDDRDFEPEGRIGTVTFSICHSCDYRVHFH